MEINQSAFGVWEARLDALDSFRSLCFGSRCYVDIAVVLVQDLRKLFAYTGGSTCDEKDLLVLLGFLRFDRESANITFRSDLEDSSL